MCMSSVCSISVQIAQANLFPGQGRITSFYGPDLTRYTSLRAHPAVEGPVLQFLFHEKGVISLASNSVHLCSRRGLTQWHISYVKKPFYLQYLSMKIPDSFALESFPW